MAIPFLSDINVEGSGDFQGDLKTQSELFDRDGNSQVRNISRLLDTLEKTLPGPFEPLSEVIVPFGNHSGKLCSAASGGFVYGSDQPGSVVSNIVFDDLSLDIGPFSNANEGDIVVNRNGTVIYSIPMTGYSPDLTPGTSAPQSGYPSSGIRITELTKQDRFVDTPWFEIPPAYCLGMATAVIPKDSLRLGSNTILVQHKKGEIVYGSDTIEVFYDGYEVAVSVNSRTLIAVLSGTRNLSGKPFAGVGTILTDAFTLNALFGGSIQQGTVLSSSISFLGSTIQRDYEDGSGYTQPTPVLGEGASFTINHTVSGSTFRVSENITCALTVTMDNEDREPSVSTIPVTGNPVHIWTGVKSSSDTKEYFTDETRRVPVSAAQSLAQSAMNSMPSPGYDSSASLLPGELQAYPGKLIYPRHNYSSASPAGPDYSLLTGDRSYVRAFNGFSQAEAGGKLTISGITRSDIESDLVKVEICIPGVTAWGNLKESYFSPVDSDGDGCYHPAAGDGSGGTFGFYMGHSFSEGGSANAILVRITIPESAKEQIEVTSVTVAPLN